MEYNFKKFTYIHFLISIKQMNILIIQGMIETRVKTIISIKIRMIYIQL